VVIGRHENAQRYRATIDELVSNEAFGTALSDFSAIEWRDYGLEKSFFDDSGGRLAGPFAFASPAGRLCLVFRA
jgi:hypothetical protein